MSDQDSSYICNICNKGFAGPLTLKIHERVHTNRKTSPKTSREPKENRFNREKQLFECKTCEKTFPKLWELKIHENVHIVKKSSPKTSSKPNEDFREKQSLKCTKCEKTFSKLSQLKSHEKIYHTGEKISRLRSSEQHEDLIKITRKKPIFECGRCEMIMIFPNLSELKNHEKRYHTNLTIKKTSSKPKGYLNESTQKKQIFECGRCEMIMIFPNLLELKNHEKRYHTDTNTSCKTSMESKKESTRKKQIFECVICDMIFPKLWIYKNHEKQYHSDQIDIKSEPNENLYESTQENHEDKPFACKFCPERFEDVEKIMGHIKIHEIDEKNDLEKEVLSDESSDLEVIGKYI